MGAPQTRKRSSKANHKPQGSINTTYTDKQGHNSINQKNDQRKIELPLQNIATSNFLHRQYLSSAYRPCALNNFPGCLRHLSGAGLGDSIHRVTCSFLCATLPQSAWWRVQWRARGPHDGKTKAHKNPTQESKTPCLFTRPPPKGAGVGSDPSRGRWWKLRIYSHARINEKNFHFPEFWSSISSTRPTKLGWHIPLRESCELSLRPCTDIRIHRFPVEGYSS
ncbi:hypothetical protein FHX37_2637 [Haloactinospora alba]|uniref:Uncharacterized protein n=1 Tax=Haloactinospora alba TaxID=405555 RepID=A0A543NLG0_9ACTN|nr:hypothetical protein FHX37_2637 [Haloactinospora alba]